MEDDEALSDIAVSLSWPWSSLHEGGKLGERDLRLAVTNFPHFKPVVRMRLLMAIWHQPRHIKDKLGEELERVAKLARSDDDQWVRVVAAAVGDFRGPLSITSLEALPVVRDTIGNIERLLEHHEAAGGGVVVPEAAYLSPYAAQCAGLPRCRDEERTSHFEARESRVPPFVPLLPSRGPTAAASGEGLGGASGEMGNRGGVASGRSAGESLGLDDDGLEWEELSMGEGEGAGRMSGAEGEAGNSSGAGAGASGGYGAGRGSYNPGSLGSGPMVKRPRR